MSTRANTRRRPKKARKPMDLRRLARRTGIAMLVIGVAGIGAWGAMSLNKALSVVSWQIDAPPSLRTAIEGQLAGQSLDFAHSFPPLLRYRLLKAIPELADVHIARRMSGTLEIRAIPRQPVANWVGADGRMLLVDGSGTAYAGTERVPPILPMLRVPASQLVKASALLAHLAKLAPNRFAQLSEMDAIDHAWTLVFDRGQSWTVPRHGAIARVDRLYALMKQPRWHKDAWRVDARMDGRWFIRPAHSKEVI